MMTMCDECRSTPCNPSCPYEETPPVYCCEICGAEIYEGDYWWDVNDMILCEDCVNDMRRTA